MNNAHLKTVLALVFVLALPPTVQSQERNEKVSNSVRLRMHRVAELTNIERIKEGLAPLKLQENLSTASLWMANDMAQKNYFGHQDSVGRAIGQRLPGYGYKHYRTIAENIAAGQTSAREVVASWMRSPGHRANLLSPYFRELGVGYVAVPGTTYETYWVQDFGMRRNTCPVVVNLEAMTTASPKVQLYMHGAQWGASEMRFSNDGQHWTAWETYRPNVDWTLEGEDGEKTVYAEVRNSDGDVISAEDTILLQTEKPKSTGRNAIIPRR